MPTPAFVFGIIGTTLGTAPFIIWYFQYRQQRRPSPVTDSEQGIPLQDMPNAPPTRQDTGITFVQNPYVAEGDSSLALDADAIGADNIGAGAFKGHGEDVDVKGIVGSYASVLDLSRKENMDDEDTGTPQVSALEAIVRVPLSANDGEGGRENCEAEFGPEAAVLTPESMSATRSSSSMIKE